MLLGGATDHFHLDRKHLEKIQPLIDAGTIVVGGATFDSHDATEGENPQMTGSMLIVVSESIEDVRKIVEDDVYATSGVWDLERVCEIKHPSLSKSKMFYCADLNTPTRPRSCL
jgi:uncharacterized protein YciI